MPSWVEPGNGGTRDSEQRRMHEPGDKMRRGRGAEAPPAAPVAAIAAFAVAMGLVACDAAASESRTIALYNIHTKTTLEVTFKRDGRFVPEALEKINWHLRDWRRNEATKMDPDLIDLVWEIHREVGSSKPIHVISAFRSPKTNEMLRKSRGGQARRSQHLLGKAMDVHFPDVPVRTLRYSALIREQGGVGYYPTSATPFVHIDTGRVRHWPRMGRQELALLFPHGRTRHRPSSGGPISRADAVNAREANPSLARRVVAFHEARRNGTFGSRPSTLVAAATPQLTARPQVVARPRPPEPVRASLGLSSWGYTFKPAPPPTITAPAPRIAAPQPEPARPPLAALPDGIRRLRPPPSINGPTGIAPAISDEDRSRLAKLAALFAAMTPKAASPADPGMATEWVNAPAFDEEHPEELFYRPFPVMPYITATASADDPALQHLTHPSVEETLDYLVADGAPDRPFELRPTTQTASLLWALAFSGASSDSTRGALASRQAPHQSDSVLARNYIRIAGNR